MQLKIYYFSILLSSSSFFYLKVKGILNEKVLRKECAGVTSTLKYDTNYAFHYRIIKKNY